MLTGNDWVNVPSVTPFCLSRLSVTPFCLPSGRYSLQITSNDITDAANSTMRPTEYKMVELTAVIADQDVLMADVLLVRLKPGENNRFDLLF